MDIRTHAAIDQTLCGSIRSLAPGRAVVVLETTDHMAVDERGLVHGGFIFGLADHAAMAAVNEPLVVLTAANARFVAPVKAGEMLVAEGLVADGDAVEVTVSREDQVVMVGEFSYRVLDRHVLDR